MIGDGKSTYTDSTLKGFKKTTLISFIRCLESNLISANETIDIQTKQCEKLIKSTELAYYQKGRADAIDECINSIMQNNFKVDIENPYTTEIICICKNEMKRILLQLKEQTNDRR